MSKKTDNLVHIRFEYDLALETKRDIISSQLNMVRMSKALQRYQELRKAEFEIRKQMATKLRSLKIQIGSFQNLLPETRADELVEDIYNEHQPEGKKKKNLREKEARATKEKQKGIPQKVMKEKKKMPEEDNLESQLAKIQDKLSSISA